MDFSGKHIHFIGIGGISMSGLAELVAARGATVTGSDRSPSPTTERLCQSGITVHIGHSAQWVQHADLVVFTAAVKADNPEYAAALAAGIPLWRRSQLLGELMRGFAQPVVISGAHGKTTTTGMIATVFEGCQAQPTVHNGGVLAMYGDATHLGGSHFFIAEGCEYTDSFLDFFPRMAVLLNIDEDHLDYFRDIEHITDSFRRYVSRLPQDGLVLCNGDDARCVQVAAGAPCAYVTFGMGEDCTYRAVDLQQQNGKFTFTLCYAGQVLCTVHTPLAGLHNVYNATAAIAAAHANGLDAVQAAEALQGYRGAQRRLQHTGFCNQCEVYQDYAHHPAELRAVLSAVKLMGYRRILCAFQPHTYSRTKALFDRFVHAFSDCDLLVLLDIYAAREQDEGVVSARMLQQAISANKEAPCCVYAPDFATAAQILRAAAQPGDVILTLGAGSIEALNPLLQDDPA